jgi:hypothetical protein
LSGREGFGVFEEMKCLFSIAPKDEKGGEVAGEKHSSNAGLMSIGR